MVLKNKTTNKSNLNKENTNKKDGGNGNDNPMKQIKTSFSVFISIPSTYIVSRKFYFKCLILFRILRNIISYKNIVKT